MSLREGKRLWKLMIDQEFNDLIRPLFKNEYLQLEENLLADGCREPITVWNNIIVDGHNRYRICTQHEIPFAVVEMYFSCREEAVAWICANQLGRRNLTEESRKYLIGKQYESEKIISRRKVIYRSGKEDASVQPYESFDPASDRTVALRKKTGERIAEENHISHGTVEKYSKYTKAIEEIREKEPKMATKILSGRYKVSHDAVLALAQRSPEEIASLNERLEKSQYPFARYQTTRQEIQGSPLPVRQEKAKKPSIKDMPEYDPDAEVNVLTLTIPSWSSSIDRIVRSDLSNISVSARANLFTALTDLQNTIDNMIAAIKEKP